MTTPDARKGKGQRTTIKELDKGYVTEGKCDNCGKERVSGWAIWQFDFGKPAPPRREKRE
jgi:uncharacterized OB-fold protein